TWKSNDETIATVSPIGYVTGVNKGTTTITASTSNGIKATCQVTVTAENTPKDGSSFDRAYFYPLYSYKTERSVTLKAMTETFYYINLTDSYTKLNFAKDSKFVNGITLKLYNDKEKLLETDYINEDESKGSYSLANIPAGKYYIGIKHSYLSTVTGNFYIWKN
ncbi:MAG TPA: Ig-like domain-containing protein, partial [Treponemataceae bacterium]|nr:Ig-like domain-containing protein [Treponemataceae bacterium]